MVNQVLCTTNSMERDTLNPVDVCLCVLNACMQALPHSNHLKSLNLGFAVV